MYSYAISGMSREMMKMDGRGRAKCQNWKKRDKIGNLKFDLNGTKRQKFVQCCLPQLKMSREMMKMDSRGRAKCQNWKKRDKIGNLKFDLNGTKRQKFVQCCLPQLK